MITFNHCIDTIRNLFCTGSDTASGRLILEVKAKNPAGDMRIQKDKWIGMARKFGAEVDDRGLNWKKVGDRVDIYFSANVKAPTDMSFMFRRMKGGIAGLDKLDVSEVTNASCAFEIFVGEAEDSDFANWKTGNIRDFSYMFDRCSNVNPDVSTWDMRSATTLKGMFLQNMKANPDVSNWNVKNVKTINHMFYEAEIANPDISKWRFNEQIGRAHV